MFGRECWKFAVLVFFSTCCAIGLLRLQASDAPQLETPQSNVRSPSPPAPIPEDGRQILDVFTEIDTDPMEKQVDGTNMNTHVFESFDLSENSNFYRTIIDNNLFAPLGTVLHRKSAPGASLTLIGTFVSAHPIHSTALLKNETTGQQVMVVMGEIFDDFQVVEIQPKRVTLDHNGQSIRLHLPENMLLNAKRR